MIVILIEIGELLHDAISGSAILFSGAYVLGKLLQLIADAITNDYL